MKTVNLYEAKTQLSALVEEAAQGEEIIIAKNGKPVARLVKLEAPARRPIQFGAWAGLKIDWPDFDEADEEIERMFYGEDYDALVAGHERVDLGAEQPVEAGNQRPKRVGSAAKRSVAEPGKPFRNRHKD